MNMSVEFRGVVKYGIRTLVLKTQSLMDISPKVHKPQRKRVLKDTSPNEHNPKRTRVLKTRVLRDNSPKEHKF